MSTPANNPSFIAGQAVAVAGWWLHSNCHTVSWGPFENEERAWRMLFGRPTNVLEQADERDAGWAVDQVKDHPRRREAA
jgi:hypothetical protein